MASPRYVVALHVDPRFAHKAPGRKLAALARRVLREERVAAGSGLSLALTDDETVRELNRRYRGLDEPTDVLSFGLETDGFVTTAAGRRQVGEVVISFETAERQARAAGHGLGEELAHLVAHGVLHLLGYDHERPREAREMRAREEVLLGRAAH